MRLVAILSALTATSCGGCSDGNHDVLDAAVDAAVGDASRDAAIDAGLVFDPNCAGTSPSCTTTPTTFVTIAAPARAANMVRVDDTLYVSTYDLVNSQVTAGRVIAADLASAMRTTLIPGTNAYKLAAARGWVYAVGIDTPNGSIWRFRPGVTPTELISGRSSLRAVTADDTHFYWAENSLILRRPIAGGNIEPVMQCPNANVLVVDDTHLYCAQSDQNIFQAPKNGGQTEVPIGSSTYPFTDMIKCAGTLYATNVGEQKLFAIATPSGPISTFASPPGTGRFYGVAPTEAHFYATASGMTTTGVYKIDRLTAGHELIAPGELAESTPVTWNGQLLFVAPDIGVRRCVD